ncbi:MAG: translation initiation factor IF-6 [Candidatus Aenigmatarchaeota archaeon]
MHFLKTNFRGDPNIGLYGFATDSYCIIGMNDKKIVKKGKRILKVPVYHETFFNTWFAGIFASGNSSGIVVPKIARSEAKNFEKHFDVFSIDTDYTALGNLILMNDNGIILSPLLKKHKTEIEKFFRIPCVITKIAFTTIVGKVGFATNKACILHPNASRQEISVIGKVLDVDVSGCTVGFGSPFSGAGIIGNSNGFLVSESTTGYETGAINEALGFL